MKKLISSLLFTVTFLATGHAQETITKVNDTALLSPIEIPIVAASTSTTLNAADNTTIQFAPNYKQAMLPQDGRYPSPYKMSWKVDLPITVAGIGLSYLGTQLINNKRDLTELEVRAKTRDKLPFFDRGNAGYYSEKADEDSYLGFHASFALPVAMVLLNSHQRHNAFQVLSLYVETMAITGTLFTMTAGTVYRSRPYVYGNNVDLAEKMDNDSHRSFFAGHTAATASASFFAAKVFSDFNPDSKLKPVIWGIAAALPAIVGYQRYKAGMHFLSDNLLGYAIGAAAGIYVPQLHKIDKLKNLSIMPQAGKNYKGLAFTYKL
jgi:membrane-associated phospholipid phosphatase